jgi:hypothetical protein
LGFHGVPVGFRVFFLPPGYSFRLSDILDTEVDDVRDDSWRGSFMKGLYLAAKPSHVEGDGLAYPLHRPTTSSYQVRGQGLSARH